MHIFRYLGAMNTWPQYVTRLMGDATQSDVALAVGVNQSTVSRWRRGAGKGPLPAQAVLFARYAGRPEIEGLVAAGMLDISEARDILPADSLTFLLELSEVESGYKAIARQAVAEAQGEESSDPIPQTPDADAV